MMLWEYGKCVDLEIGKTSSFSEFECGGLSKVFTYK